MIIREPKLWRRSENVARVADMLQGMTLLTFMELAAAGLVYEELRHFDEAPVAILAHQIAQAGIDFLRLGA